MSKIFRYIVAGLLLVLLVLIRAFEDKLFYDPYLTFFENDYLYMDSPRREVLKLALNTTLRFLMNSLCSLGIIYMIFKDKLVLRFSIFIFIVSYIILLVPFLYFVISPKQEDYYLFFNIRRFLIQPIILILLLPALYYNKLKSRQKIKH